LVSFQSNVGIIKPAGPSNDVVSMMFEEPTVVEVVTFPDASRTITPGVRYESTTELSEPMVTIGVPRPFVRIECVCSVPTIELS
jgi:hypothetical protein